ncbi:UBC-like protein, partial [Eremomyces bilateralis CBS 781.70]
MKRLMTELTTLRSSLPEGIYLRYCSGHLGKMKAIIVGPSGTPYEGGLFEFDIDCPMSYPNTPPNFNFKTTGGGTVRFNPNLYPDGKVCLSLLGTWQGESWRPGESTLLQVLISLQSMVLCDEPWYNEPGRERRKQSRESESYNEQVWYWTTNHAM